ncbi:DNA-binding transcriptional regulator Fis [Marinimicrobium sp. ARAG 43.8]|uniref:DNA-binding transcriptional regulator Fis n=1 Tax=Marinimicrobium sp. ARAG 43.8 TaxID=3418719 RepID=UPI003CF524F0
MNTAENLLADVPMDNPGPATTTTMQGQSLRGCVEQAMENYFQNLDGQPVSDVYNMVMAEVEAPMLEIVLKYTRHNQTRAAQVLGLNRGTLRKKLKQYDLL